METVRRLVIEKLIASVTVFAGFSYLANAKSVLVNRKKVGKIIDFQEVPLLSRHIQHNNLVYLAGRGAHEDDRTRKNVPFDIKTHTDVVLKELEKELIKSGSSMEKVLKVSVFLCDIADYNGMNEVYKGRFGKEPPVRTTVATVKGGIPAGSLVEIDCIAYI